jgi:hypothetical protein
LRTQTTEAFTGQAFSINYRHEARDWFFRADHFANGEDFRADLGFVSRVDRNTTVVGGGYYWWNENSWWNRIRLNGDWDIAHNDDGELIEKEVEAYLSIRGDYQSFFEVGYVKRDRVGLRQDPSVLSIDNNADLFTEKQFRMFFETQPNEILYINTFASVGDQIDFTNNRLGERFFVEGEVELNIGQHLYVGGFFLYNDFEADEQPLFMAKLLDARFTYQFDTRQFLRLILSYSDIDRNQANYIDSVDAESQDLGWQLLYSYKVNPLTKFFIGVSDSSFNDDSLTRLTSAEQSVFMKFSYAWLQ